MTRMCAIAVDRCAISANRCSRMARRLNRAPNWGSGGLRSARTTILSSSWFTFCARSRSGNSFVIITRKGQWLSTRYQYEDTHFEVLANLE